ncbi:MAG: starch-binding protein [Bacilli bacterium]|nr:starch-binding protein [Bacilli bacterium]
MKKKTILITSSILACSLLAGATFAAYAITDSADPFGVNITPGNVDEDDTTYVTLRWGESTSTSNDISEASAGSSYKLGVYSLVATQNYSGVLSVTLTDETTAQRVEGQHKFIDYLKLYIYEGNVDPLSENTLPTEDYLISSAMGATSLNYGSAVGTPSGKEYSIYIEVDSSAAYYMSEMEDDLVDIAINWNAQSGHEAVNSKTVYFSSSWEQAYLFTWDGESINRTYPGVEMSKVGINQYGQYVYQGVLFDNYTQMIFSNGGTGSENQTPDLTVSDFDFTGGDLLFWKEDTATHGAGYKVFESTDVASHKANMAINPGPILQAWGWTTARVLSNLDAIADAGYKAVQLSPLQPLASNSSTQGWYMVYQPIGLSVAGNNENPLGSRTSLQELTAAASEKGIDIIVDVVANHLKEGSTERTLDSAVQSKEPEIYNNNLIHTQGNVSGDTDTELIVKGSLDGLPDLMTEDSRVQARVIAMLKDYIDLGVKGFRFDAAKHIETPMDGDYASEFWPNVIGAINQYGLSVYNEAPYSYGEVLGVGSYRDWNGYTKYIDVTDYGVTWNVREQFNNHDEGAVLSNIGYTINQSSDYALMFAESHDNFINGDTVSSVDGDMWIDLQYGLHASRSGASSLYFARPTSSDRLGTNTKIVVTPTDGYKNALVSAANRLHNEFVGGDEYLSCWDGCVINARTLGTKYGAYIVNIHDASSASVKIAYSGGFLPDGTYTDLVTGNDVTISGGVANITFSTSFNAAVLVSK